MRKRKRTAAQKQAARSNGARSKGPLTDQSKARSALNSLKHGLTANTVVLPGENRERFQEILNDLLADLAPQTTLEFTALEEIAIGLWKQRRSWAMEADYLAGNQENQSTISRYCNNWKKLHKPGHHFTNLLIQQARVNREIDRAYRRFRDLEALRNESLKEENENVKNEPGGLPPHDLDHR